MCHILKTQFILCSHHEQELKRCQASIDNAHQDIEMPTKKGWFQSLLSSLSTRGECDSGTLRVRKVAHCSSCTAKNEIAKKDQEAKWCIRYNVEDVTSRAHSKNKSGQRASSQEQAKRSNFQCSLCAYEGRTVGPVERNLTTNGGLCCSRGMDEYRAQQEREEKYGESLLAEYEKPPVTDSAAVSRTLGGGIDPVPRDAISTQKTTMDVEKARKRFSWEVEEPHHVNPEVVKDFSSLISTTGYLLPSTTPPSPMHKEPGIDWDRWDRAPQTYHGRYPPAGVPPRKPLPGLPLRHKTGDVGSVGRNGGPAGSVHEHRRRLSVSSQKPLPPLPPGANGDKNHRHSRDIADQARPRPLALTRHSVKARLRNKEARDGDDSQDIVAQSRSPDSGILAPQVSPVSPVSPSMGTSGDSPAPSRKSMLSRLDDSIDETMQYWGEK